MDDDDSVIDDEELRALALRFRFTEYTISGDIWRAMQDAGWKYSKRLYQSPDYYKDGKPLLLDSKECLEYLDRFSMSELYSNLQSSSTKAAANEEEERRGQRLRRDILYHLYLRTSNSKGDKTENDDSAAQDRTIQDSEGTHATRPRRSTRAATNSKQASVTTAEKGSDLYLHKHSKGRKSKGSKTAAVTTETDNLHRPTLKECAALIKKYPIDEVIAIEEAYKSQYEDWRFLLSTNHSLLFFGAGSKFNLLNAFCYEELEKEGYTLVIDGFDKEVSIQAILDLLVAIFLDGKEPSATAAIPNDGGDFPIAGISNPWRAHPVLERAIAISRTMARKAAESMIPVFLVIHNLEGEGLRNSLAQDALAALVVNSTVGNGVASIRLAASVDHVDASVMLWSVSTSANFSWIWKEVHTRRPYDKELAMLSDEDVRKKSTKRKMEETERAERAVVVLKNLAPRHSEVVQILARMQLEQPKSSTWVEYVAFRNRCKNNCAINKDSQLRAYLMELKDHRLIVSKTDDRSEYVRIPYEESKLHEMLAYDPNQRA